MKRASSKTTRRILAADVGGTHVKVLLSGEKQPRKIVSGPGMTARRMVSGVKKVTKDWKYNAVSIGYPGPVIHGCPMQEPHNLGHGWVAFDFRKAFGCPVKVINDAAMQAIGSYKGGRMLFLGLGTGLGTAMIIDGIVQPMEIAHLPYKKGKTYEDYIGRRGLQRLGKRRAPLRVSGSCRAEGRDGRGLCGSGRRQQQEVKEAAAQNECRRQSKRISRRLSVVE